VRLFISAAARAFRESEDGLTLQELGRQIGTRWPGRVFHALVHEGFVFGEHDGRLFLAVDPDVERPSSLPDPPGGRSVFVLADASAPAARRLSARLPRLFDVSTMSAAYREDV
jgi:hypothetical protein